MDTARPDPNAELHSREPLRIAGETTFPIPALAVPDARTKLGTETLQHYEATRLFVERATAANPAFAATARNAAPIVDICRRLDGIPLAIELAAARVRALPVETIDARLTDRFRPGSGPSPLPSKGGAGGGCERSELFAPDQAKPRHRASALLNPPLDPLPCKGGEMDGSLPTIADTAYLSLPGPSRGSAFSRTAMEEEAGSRLKSGMTVGRNGCITCNNRRDCLQVQAVKSPDLPPVLAIRRTFSMTMRLSSALAMS